MGPKRTLLKKGGNPVKRTGAARLSFYGRELLKNLKNEGPATLKEFLRLPLSPAVKVEINKLLRRKRK